MAGHGRNECHHDCPGKLLPQQQDRGTSLGDVVYERDRAVHVVAIPAHHRHEYRELRDRLQRVGYVVDGEHHKLRGSNRRQDLHGLLPADEPCDARASVDVQHHSWVTNSGDLRLHRRSNGRRCQSNLERKRPLPSPPARLPSRSRSIGVGRFLHTLGLRATACMGARRERRFCCRRKTCTTGTSYTDTNATTPSAPEPKRRVLARISVDIPVRSGNSNMSRQFALKDNIVLRNTPR